MVTDNENGSGTNDIRGVILPVGVTADPVLFSIRELQPEYLGLIGTRQSERTMDEVFRQIAFPPHKTRVEIVEDSPECIGDLTYRVYDIYHWMRCHVGLSADQIAIDPTPGRKWMSAGTTMVASYLGLTMFYVDVRFVGGRPDPSSMRLIRLGNAFDQTGFLLSDRGCVMFNSGHYAAAARFFRRIRPSRSQETDYFHGLAELADALHRWDLFEHYQHSLREQFDIALESLRRFARGGHVPSEFHHFLEQVSLLADAIDQVTQAPRPTLLAVADLTRNAERRIRQGHYDDAVARLYRAFEALAQYHLVADFGIDPSDPQWDGKAPEVRAAVQRACGQMPKNVASVHGWTILRELGHPVASHVFVPAKNGQWRMKLEGLLGDRNNSILAHGWRPISRDRAEKMFERIVELLGSLESQELSEAYQRLSVPAIPTMRRAAADAPEDLWW
ncbi:MAG: CRISPR-associated protein [Pirellulaceae bacterium]|nr:MAG: CRISPR-associated protein [Pirellulaceae bacterium]